MTDREKAFLQDLVEISISAQKVIQSGSFSVAALEEVVMLREMTAHILRTYTRVRPSDSAVKEDG